MDWMSIEDELPGEDQRVIAYHPDWGIDIVTWYQGQFSYIGLIHDRPTHWMLLPEPPPGVKEE